MKKIITFLDGKKTFLASLVGTLIGLAYLFDYLTTDQFNALVVVAGSFGLVGVRDAMNKIQTPKKKSGK